MSGGQRWEVVDAGSGDGVIVREAKEANSPEVNMRLGKGAVVEELELVGTRLHFRLVYGQGPETGWVSTKKFMMGKDVLVPVGGAPPPQVENKAAPPPAEDTIGEKMRGPRAPAVDVGQQAEAKLTRDRTFRMSKGRLPPIDRIEYITETDCLELFGFSQQTAKEFMNLPVEYKKMIADECKKMFSLSAEKRGRALQEMRRGIRGVGSPEPKKPTAAEPLAYLQIPDGGQVAVFPHSTRKT